MFFLLNKDVSFELSMKDEDEIGCVLLDVADKYKSCFGVKFLEKIGTKKGKRIISLNDGIFILLFIFGLFYCLFVILTEKAT